MSTVGYGDKIPKSVAARLFSIVWIFVGITNFSIVTAMLTSEIFKVSSTQSAHTRMQNARIGLLRDHTYETIVVSNHGGIVMEANQENITDGVSKLNHLLHLSEIDGYVLDKYEMLRFFDHYKNHPQHKKEIDYIRSHAIITETDHIDKLAYGILIKEEEDYQFFRDYMLSSQEIITSCTNLFINSYSRKVQVKQYQRELPTFFLEGRLFLPSLVVCAVLILIILSCGAAYELRKKPKTDTENPFKARKGVQKMKDHSMGIGSRKKESPLWSKNDNQLVPVFSPSMK